MNLSDKTPAEIDNLYATALENQAFAFFEIENLSSLLEDEGKISSSYYTPSRIEALQVRLVNAKAQLAESLKVIDAVESEFNARNGWTRYYLVRTNNGHIHSTTACSTCFPTTQFGFLPDYSGSTEQDLVEDAGEKACTVCFPWAPVDVLSRPSKIEDADKKAAREEREAKKAAAAAKKAAKAIGPIDVTTNGRFREVIETVYAAKQFLTDEVQYKEWGWTNSLHTEEQVQAVVEALAEKEGKTVEQVQAEAEKRFKNRK